MAMLRTVTARLRHTELMLRQSEKMAALGTLSAGLAHELNNPAAAVQRTATQLRERWLARALHQHAPGLGFEPQPRSHASSTPCAWNCPSGAAGPSSSLARGDRRARSVAGWRSRASISRGNWRPPSSPSAGTPPIWKTSLSEPFSSTQQAALLVAGYGMPFLRPAERRQPGRRADFRDREGGEVVRLPGSRPVQLVDVHEGIEDTLVILRYKLKQGVTVIREYDPNLPRIEAYASELNQVWTNIIDNAMDAMQGKGEIRIKTLSRPGDPGQRRHRGRDNR